MPHQTVVFAERMIRPDDFFIQRLVDRQGVRRCPLPVARKKFRHAESGRVKPACGMILPGKGMPVRGYLMVVALPSGLFGLTLSTFEKYPVRLAVVGTNALRPPVGSRCCVP